MPALTKLLTAFGIEAVADVRSTPYSGRLPQFNREALRAALMLNDIQYVFLGDELGGRGHPDSVVDDAGRVIYSAMAEEATFKHGINRLLSGAPRLRIAMLCSEADPLNCHRGLLISRILQARGVQVNHIHRDGNFERHVDAERRLIRITGVPQVSELFRSSAEALDEAYAVQESRVAYSSAPTDKGKLA